MLLVICSSVEGSLAAHIHSLICLAQMVILRLVRDWSQKYAHDLDLAFLFSSLLQERTYLLLLSSAPSFSTLFTVCPLAKERTPNETRYLEFEIKMDLSFVSIFNMVYDFFFKQLYHLPGPDNIWTNQKHVNQLACLLSKCLVEYSI